MLRQSERHAAYRDAIERLLDEGLAYACTCSRKQLEGYPYPGFCRAAGRSLEDAAIRLRVPDREYVFIDRVQGEFRQHLGREVGDFVIRRRDGLIAYQLAVVLDDAWQGVTDVVRGADLLDSTPRQLYLQEVLGLPQPRYLHLPLIIQPDGHKLGKSYRSPPLQAQEASPLLLRALRALASNRQRNWTARCQRTFSAGPLPTGMQHASRGSAPSPKPSCAEPRMDRTTRGELLPAAGGLPRAAALPSPSLPTRDPACISTDWCCSWWWGSTCSPRHHGLVDRPQRCLVSALSAVADPDRGDLHSPEPA